MADKHQGRQTAEWLAAWIALDTLEAFWRAQDIGQEAAVDRVLSAQMAALLTQPGFTVFPALTSRRARRRMERASGSAALLSLSTGSTDESAKVPLPLRPAYAVIEAGIQHLHSAL